MNSKLKTENSKFNAPLALTCVRASSRAYLTATDSEPSTDTHYLVLELPDRVVIAFRGTSSLEDFLCDADFFTTRINLNDDARVHLGFYKAYKSIESRLKARLDEIISRRDLPTQNLKLKTKKSIPIVFSGHSLGGALAILAAYYLNRFYNIEAVYTFGAPDIGNATFARHYNASERGCPRPQHLPTLDHLQTTLDGRACTPCAPSSQVASIYQNSPRVLECGGKRSATPLSDSPTPNISAGSPPPFSPLPPVKSPLGGKTFCLANAGDPVTWLPPYRFGFRRVGKFFFLPGVTWMVPGFNAPPLARVITGAIQVFQNWRHGKLALLSNHFLTLYKQRVEKLACARGTDKEPTRTPSLPLRVQRHITLAPIGGEGRGEGDPLHSK